MYPQKIGVRAEYLQEETARIKDSPTLAQKYPSLKFLRVVSSQTAPGANPRPNEIKYTVNLTFAKSLFRFACLNHNCVGGNFDLSGILAQAIASRARSIHGEQICGGWECRNKIDRIPCGRVLHYKLILRYQDHS